MGFTLEPVLSSLLASAFLSHGTVKEGYLDGAGHARIEAVPNQAAKVYFGESPDPFQAEAVSLISVDDDALREDLLKLGLNPDTADLQGLVDKESGRSA